VAALVLSGAAGALPWQVFAQLYATYTVVAGVNTVRLLGAHRYLGDEDTMSVLQQVADTVNYPRSWPAEAWAPVGLRLHALHHMLPGLPYHAYAQAHRRLLAALPSGSVYHEAAAPGLWSSLRRLWRTSGRHSELHGLDAAQALAAADGIGAAARVR
jgi:fatty acid desaturase